MEFDENAHQFNQELTNYFLQYNNDEILAILENPRYDIYFDIFVNISQLFNYNPTMINIFYETPIEFLIISKKSFIEAQQIIYAQEECQDHKIKLLIQIRVLKIPWHPQIYKKNFHDMSVLSLNKFAIIRATVIRVGARKSLERSKIFECEHCKQQFELFSDPSKFNTFEMPQKCSNIVMKETKTNPFMQLLFKKKINQNQMQQQSNQQPKMKNQMCGCKKFIPIEGTEKWIDYQEIKIQEPFKTLKPGLIPNTIWVVLDGNLVDLCKPGDDIIMIGILLKRLKKFTTDQRLDISMFIYGNSLTVIKNEKVQFDNAQKIHVNVVYQEEIENYWDQFERNLINEIKVKNDIIKSICTSIFEKYDIKLALILILIGGVTQIKNKTRIRGQCHMLLVGEPGTGKSSLLKYACSLSQRAVFTNGIGSSSAGLTLSFIKENNEWMIEAGALVLSDLGICCIDEFNLIKKQDQASVLEAMEQQTISTSKAGITTKVNTRASIIAACNPVLPGQKYNSDLPLTDNTGIQTPLLSRFDLIFTIIDQSNFQVDSENCAFILEKVKFIQNHINYDLWNSMKNLFLIKDNLYFIIQFLEENNSEQFLFSAPQQNFQWNVQKLNVFLSYNYKEYIKYIQCKFDPTISQEAELTLIQYYKHLRTLENHGRATTRSLESLIRLSQAHSRLMFRNQVIQFDAISIVILMECQSYTGLIENFQFVQNIIIDHHTYQ